MKVLWEFVAHEPLHEVEPGVIAVDVGGGRSGVERVFDHHSAREHSGSSASIVRERISELDSVRRDGVTIRCHQEPDMDCAVSAFLAVSYLVGEYEEESGFVDALVRLTDAVDQGGVHPLEWGETGRDVNLYTVFLLLDDFFRREAEEARAAVESYLDGVTGLEMDCSAERGKELFMAFSFVLLRSLREGWPETEGLLERDDEGGLASISGYLCAERENEEVQRAFCALDEFVRTTTREARGELERIVEEGEYEVFSVSLPSREDPEAAVEKACVYVEAPFSVLPVLKSIRGVKRNVVPGLESFSVLAFDPADGGQANRVIISLDPDRDPDCTLQGLGLELDRENRAQPGAPESRMRRYWRRVHGRLMPDPLFPGGDPWYDGRAFGYTIVDAPRQVENRRLDPARIKEVLRSDWWERAREYCSRDYREWEAGEEPGALPEDDLFSTHLMYPLIGLVPVRLRAHSAQLRSRMESENEDHPVAVGTESDGPAEEGQFGRYLLGMIEELKEYDFGTVDGRQQEWSVGSATLSPVQDFIRRYVELSSDQRNGAECPCPSENTTNCERFEEGQIGWCPVLKCAALIPEKLRTNPSAYDLFAHQLEWLELLDGEKPVNLTFLRHTVRQALHRFFVARDGGEVFDAPEIDIADVGGASRMVDHRIARYVDYIVEEIEEICLDPGQNRDQLQERIENARHYVTEAMEVLDSVDSGGGEAQSRRKDLVVPFLANMLAFIESLDRLTAWDFAERGDASPGGASLWDAIDALRRQISSEPGDAREASEGEAASVEEEADCGPGVFFRHAGWICASLGSRICRELYEASIGSAFREYDYPRALGLACRADRVAGIGGRLRFVGKQVMRMFFTPFLLTMFLGAGVLLMAELDYGLARNLMNVSVPLAGPVMNLSLGLLLVFNVGGIWSLLSGENRILRFAALFVILLVPAGIIGTLVWWLFQRKYPAPLPSVVFLTLGILFFSVVVSRIGGSGGTDS